MHAGSFQRAYITKETLEETRNLSYMHAKWFIKQLFTEQVNAAAVQTQPRAARLMLPADRAARCLDASEGADAGVPVAEEFIYRCPP